MHGNKTNLFSSAKAMIPKPEFYVVYTGNRKNLPEFMQLSSHFKHLQRDEDPALQLKLKVLAEQYERSEGDFMEAIKTMFRLLYDETIMQATQLTASQLADLREQGENALRIC